MSQVRGVIGLFVVSYLIHAMLLVNSVQTELVNHQQPIGKLLSEQLAISAAPFIINKDSVGLGLLANHFGEADAVLNLRIVDNQTHVLATGGKAQSQQGLNFNAPIMLEKQHLGVAHIALSIPKRGDIIKNSRINLALSFLIHLFLMLWVGWPQLFKEIRVPILPALIEEEAVPEPVVITAPLAPEPIKPAASVWVHFSIDDPKGLMQKVNANTSEQFLQVIDKLIKRTTRLYTGKAVTTLNSDGITIRFDGDTVSDCAHRALLSSRLLIKLATTAHAQRRDAKQFSLKLKTVILNLGELSDETAYQQLKAVLSAIKVNQILIIDDEALLTELKNKHQLVVFEAEEESPDAHKQIKAHLLESLATDLEDELSCLEQRILARKTSLKDNHV